jgi:predicted Zn-dependent peptidase
MKTDSIFFTQYDMVQAEIIILSKSKGYSQKRAVQTMLFNEYFGGNMGSIVFQEMRESKALAYSVKSSYQTPADLEQPAYVFSYIGTQADKTIEALKGMNALLDSFIVEEGAFENAKESLLSSIETSRSIKSGILFKYLGAEKLHHKTDINQKLYDFVKEASIEDLKKFHKKYIQNKPQTYLIIGKKENIDFEKLKNFGAIKELSLEQVFGY